MTEARYQVNTYGAHWSSVDMGSLLSSCPPFMLGVVRSLILPARCWSRSARR